MRCTVSWSLRATVYLSRDEDGIGWLIFFAGVCPWISNSLIRPSFIVRDIAAEKEFDMAK